MWPTRASAWPWPPAAAREFGRLDVLVANAGGPPPGGMDDFAPEAYRRALDLNLMSTVQLTLAALPEMRRNGWGRIVAITSVAVKQPVKGLLLSNTARPGVVGFIKTISRDLAAESILCNVVAPGFIHTARVESLFEARAEARGTTRDAVLEEIAADIPAGRLGQTRRVRQRSGLPGLRGGPRTSPDTRSRSMAEWCRVCCDESSGGASQAAAPVTVEDRIRVGWGGRAGAYLELTKPGITAFVAVTAAAGYLMAVAPRRSPPRAVPPGCRHYPSPPPAPSRSTSTLSGNPTASCCAPGAARCPRGRLPASHARVFGWLLLAAGTGHIWFRVGWVPALVTAAGRDPLQTRSTPPLKLRSPIATPVGAVPGALPALIGWTAYGGWADARGMILFGILFLWQLIHVLSLGWNLRQDYERAGFQLIPRGSDRLISGLMVAHALALLPLSLTAGRARNDRQPLPRRRPRPGYGDGGGHRRVPAQAHQAGVAAECSSDRSCITRCCWPRWWRERL